MGLDGQGMGQDGVADGQHNAGANPSCGQNRNLYMLVHLDAVAQEESQG